MKPFVTTIALASMALLTACGDTKADRAWSGGLIGAGVGGVTGSLVGDPVTGAIIGGAAGAATGAATSPDQVDLGKPFWR